MHYTGSEGSIFDIIMENVNFCGKVLTASDKGDSAIINNKASSWFSEFRIV